MLKKWKWIRFRLSNAELEQAGISTGLRVKFQFFQHSRDNEICLGCRALSISWFVFLLLVSCGWLENLKLINFDLMILQI